MRQRGKRTALDDPQEEKQINKYVIMNVKRRQFLEHDQQEGKQVGVQLGVC
jgi:hypothetical protein